MNAERQRAVEAMAAGLRQKTGLDNCIKRKHRPMDYLFLADQALQAAIDSGAVTLASERWKWSAWGHDCALEGQKDRSS